MGVGLVAGWRGGFGIGLLWLAVGTPLWLLDLAAGAALAPTSALTHLGGYGVGLAAVARTGMPRHAWWQAVAGLAALQEACRWWTPPAANVNAAFAVYERFEGWFPSYAAYLTALGAAAAAVFWALETVLRRWYP
jgi:hypothetical protein